MKGCRALAKVLDVQDCCESCHVDDEDFAMPLLEIKYQGTEYLVCCTMAQEAADRAVIEELQAIRV